MSFRFPAEFLKLIGVSSIFNWLFLIFEPLQVDLINGFETTSLAIAIKISKNCIILDIVIIFLFFMLIVTYTQGDVRILLNIII